MMADKNNGVISEISSGDFERKICELKKIVDKLENDPGVTLEDSMDLFESGLGLTKECVDGLNAMQERIAALNDRLDIIMGKPPFGDEYEN